MKQTIKEFHSVYWRSAAVHNSPGMKPLTERKSERMAVDIQLIEEEFAYNHFNSAQTEPKNAKPKNLICLTIH